MKQLIAMEVVREAVKVIALEIARVTVLAIVAEAVMVVALQIVQEPAKVDVGKTANLIVQAPALVVAELDAIKHVLAVRHIASGLVKGLVMVDDVDATIINIHSNSRLSTFL